MKKNKQIKIYLCLDCTMPIGRDSALYGGGRCSSCGRKNAFKLGLITSKGKNNCHYKDGRTLKKHYCKCGNEIDRHTACYGGKKCDKCKFKGKNNPNYKYGRYMMQPCSKCSKKISIGSKCFECDLGGSRRGKNNPNWKNGITPLTRQIRACFEYRQWRSDVFTRDDFTCQDCGVRGGNLEADHYTKQFSVIFHENKIKDLQQALDCAEFWNINNGRTLCEKCHNKTKRS